MRFATLSVLLGILPTCHHSPVDGPEDQEARLEFSVTRSLQTAGADTVRVSRISAGQMAIEGEARRLQPEVIMKNPLPSTAWAVAGLILAAPARC